MLGILVLASSFLCSLSSAYVIGQLKRLRYFSGAINAYLNIRVPNQVRRKGDVRRVRKYRYLYREARRRLLLLFVLQVAIFMLFYTVSTITTMFLAGYYGTMWAKSPVAIPFFTAMNERGELFIHVIVLQFTGYLIPLHFVSRAVRLTPSPESKNI